MHNIFKNNYLKLLAAVLLLVSAYFINRNCLFERSEPNQIARFENALHEKEEKLEKEISSLAEKTSRSNYEDLFLNENEHYSSLFEKEGFLFFIYENDSLRYWSVNFAPVQIDSAAFRSKLLHLRNGWYEMLKTEDGRRKSEVGTPNSKRIIGLLLLKTEYPFENKFLVNAFQPGFYLPENAEILNSTVNHSDSALSAVSGKDGGVLCFIKLKNENKISHFSRFFLTLFNVLGFLFLLVFLKNETQRMEGKIGKNKSVSLFIFFLLALRALTLALQYPQAFYEMPLFSPEHYATSFLFPSLGDFIINVLLIFYIAYYLRVHILLDYCDSSGAQKKYLLYLLLFNLFAFSVMSEYLIKGLIEDSSISFNVNNIFELTGFSYGAIAAIGLLLFAFFFVCDTAVFVIHGFGFSLRQIIPAFIITSVPAIVFLLWLDYGLLPVLWVAVIFSTTLFIYKKRNAEYGFTNIVIIISIFSMFCAASMLKHISQKELKQRSVLAEKLAIDEDPVAELLYSEIEPKLSGDLAFSNLKYGLENYDREYFDNDLEQKYFSGYLSRYNVKSYLFKADGSPVRIADKKKSEQNYFEELISRSGRPTLNENMIHIENPEENENYIIKLLVKDRSGKEIKGILYIAMESKLQPEEAGFPELLLDKKVKATRQLTDKKYSFAKYRRDKLIVHNGNFNYSLSSEHYGDPDKKISFDDDGNYSHLIYRTDKNNAAVLSLPKGGWIENITTFSYLFAMFGILVLLFLNLRDFPDNLRVKNTSFNYKIQLMLVVVMLGSMVIFGIGTSYYINLQYEEKNHRLLSEKTHSVLIELEQKLGDEKKLDTQLQEYISYLLTKISTVLFTDINLYDAEGTLLASSRPKLFTEGIVSRKMDANAFSQMKFLQKSEFVHDEKIGALDYHSAYIPFKNKDGELLAYLNLPYFAKQDALQNEISSFLVTLINIYVFLFALLLMAALFISSAITRPLQYVQAMLGKVELGKTNKPIEYKGKDEIGRLVEVYNSKVAELEKSADLLAKSERESAWREMAKQVAHEIKNPLTPMKLSIQHLQRTLKADDKNWEETLNRFSQTIIEQIDALSTIASEFSNFAKMPLANNEAINISSVVEHALQLFKDTPDVKFIWNTEIPEALVFADKEQLLRVFINLIQNSIQAIPAGREGMIKINLLKRNEKIIVSVEDNGTGINPEQTGKIFSPNFTTKTGGMGLGLAMAKSIVESAHGKIRFETEEGKGTVFYVELPERKIK